MNFLKESKFGVFFADPALPCPVIIVEYQGLSSTSQKPAWFQGAGVDK